MFVMEVSFQSKLMVMVFESSANDFVPVTVDVFNNCETTDWPAALWIFSLAIAGITISVEISMFGNFQRDQYPDSQSSMEVFY